MEHALFNLLCNDLILHHIAPYLGVQSLLSISSLSKSFNQVIHQNPSVFRRVDLSSVRSISKPLWKPESTLCVEDYYSQPLDQVVSKFESRLKHTRTLILDGLHISFKCLMYLLANFPLQILSIRDTSILTDLGVRNALRYIMRPDRPTKSTSLHALYYFQDNRGSSEAEQLFRNETVLGEHLGVTQRSGAQIGTNSFFSLPPKVAFDPYTRSVYAKLGICRASARDLDWPDWANLLERTKGSIAFDMVLCPHNPVDLLSNDKRPKIATVRLSGCQTCGSCPEGPAYPSQKVRLLPRWTSLCYDCFISTVFSFLKQSICKRCLA